MRSQSAYMVLGALAQAASAMPKPNAAADELVARQSNATGPAMLPQDDPDPQARAKGIAIRDEGFVYGPSLIGEASPFLNGTLGNAWHEHDMALWSVDREEIDSRIKIDSKHIQETLLKTTVRINHNNPAPFEAPES